MRAVICLLLGVLGFGARAFATVEGWEIAGDPARVAINYSSNHGYYPRSWPLAFRGQVAALEAVRRDLVLKGKLENEPILIRIPDAGFTSHPEQTHLALKTVALRRGEMEEVLRARRYVIEWNNDARPEPTSRAFYDGLLHLTLSLQKLSAQKKSLVVSDWPRLQREYSRQAATYQNIVQHFDPIWSPDNQFLNFTRWQNGRADFQALDCRRRIIWKLESLKGAPACRPVWSGDGKFVAYADLKTVKIFQTANSQTQSLALPFADEHSLHEILLDFRVDGKTKNALLISGDTNLFSDYVTLNYDSKTRRVLSQSAPAARPKWAQDFLKEERAFESRRAVSSGGDWVASIEENRGLRRLVLRSSESAESFRVADLPVQNAPASQVISLAPTRTPSTAPRSLPQIEKSPTPALPQPISPSPASRGQSAFLVVCSAALAALLFFLLRFFKRNKS